MAVRYGCLDRSQKFRSMLHDSKTAESCKQGETKAKYAFQFGMTPYWKDILQNFKNQPFTFKFDETTTS